jgi:hypothetical protein
MSLFIRSYLLSDRTYHYNFPLHYIIMPIYTGLIKEEIASSSSHNTESVAGRLSTLWPKE